jgi:hypothetical protein
MEGALGRRAVALTEHFELDWLVVALPSGIVRAVVIFICNHKQPQSVTLSGGI